MRVKTSCCNKTSRAKTESYQSPLNILQETHLSKILLLKLDLPLLQIGADPWCIEQTCLWPYDTLFLMKRSTVQLNLMDWFQ